MLPRQPFSPDHGVAAALPAVASAAKVGRAKAKAPAARARQALLSQPPPLLRCVRRLVSAADQMCEAFRTGTLVFRVAAAASVASSIPAVPRSTFATRVPQPTSPSTAASAISGACMSAAAWRAPRMRLHALVRTCC